jgi:DNA polymerase III sliding clamp (beta) subunit (PCNA family)
MSKGMTKETNMQHETMSPETATDARAIVTLNAAEFANAAKLLASKVIERRNSIPVLSALLIEVEPCGRVTLSGTDLDILARIELQADAGETIEPGRLCLDAGPLSDALAKARKDSDRVRLTQTDSNRATLKAGRGVWALRGHDAELFPALAYVPAPDMSAPIPAGQFLADLKALAPAVSTEETRYYLNGYAMQARDMAGRDSLVMVATDGSNMAAASRPMPAGLAGWQDAILPRKTGAVILAAAKIYDAGEAVTLSRFGNDSAGKVAVRFGPVRIVSKLIDGTFPDWPRAFEGMATPTSQGEAPLFPDMMPGRPLAAMEAFAKAAPVAVEWQEGEKRYFGAAASDPGLAWCAMMLAKDSEPRKGYRYSDGMSRYDAREYLKALAEGQGLPSVASYNAKAERVNDAPGSTLARTWGHIQTEGERVLGLTVGGYVTHPARTETVQDWEALCEREITIPAFDEVMEGSYSILMPAGGPAIEPDYSVTVEGDRRYPVAVNSGATQIHLSKEQVAALIGDSVWEVIEIPGADGRARYVSAWCYEQGDSRLLCVGKDGRCPKAGAAREYVSREQVAAALAGEAIMTEAPAIEAAAPTVEAISAEIGNTASAPETALPCDGEPAPATHAAPMPEIAPVAAPVAAETPCDADPDPIAAVRARLAEIEALLAALPVASARPKRTPAHERAIRRAWAERKARRYAVAGAAAFRDMAETTEAEYQRVKAERDAAKANAEAIETSAATYVRGVENRERAVQDRARLAEQEAAEAKAMRDEMRGLVTALERRAEMAETENAELWAEIEALTAPATPVGAIAAEAGAA